MHTSKTIKYRKVRLLFSLAASFTFSISNKDFTKAYIQGLPITRDTYAKPAP